ncbi:MAG: hypothetical protein E2O52_03265 [Gammaproteobacteria bacterium]|nr:MAG: hypothetical protein E2O52_03265 [Gammaproteobacteria bacterium]
MSLYEVLIIFHLLLFVYWLGGDMGVFYASGMSVDPKLSNAARVTAAKIMMNLDFVPRICMTLMLTVGGLLSSYNGVEHPQWQTVAFILLGPGWLSMVAFLHFAHGTDLSKLVTKIDYWFRWAIVVYLLWSVSYSFMFTDKLADAPWVGGKLLVFAVMVFCGLMIRVYIPGYIQGIVTLRQEADKPSMSDEMNSIMSTSLAKCRPYVLVIWAGLFIECWLGVVKPGNAVPVSEILGAAAPFAGF